MNSIDDILQQELDDTLAQEFKKRKQQRCQAVVSPQALELRANGPPGRRCRRGAQQEVGENWFCRQHAPLWAVHQDIVERILSIPPRV